METSPVSEREIRIPTYIDEVWVENFNRQHAHEQTRPRFSAELEAEDWLVQPVHGVGGSAYFELQDALGPFGSYRVIRGIVWNAGITPTPQYLETANSPILALLDAKIVMPDGTETLINKNDPDYGLVLVRLDRVKDSRIKIGSL